MFGSFLGNSEMARFGLRNVCWLSISRLRLCFALNQILLPLNYYEKFPRYFAQRTILQASIFYRPHFTAFLLLYDLSLEKKKCFVEI